MKRTLILAMVILLALGCSVSASSREARAMQQAASRGVDPFYPAMRQVSDYSSPTIASRELSLKLKNGMPLQLGRFESVLSLDGEWKISGLTNSREPFPENADCRKGHWDTITVPLNWYVKYPENRIVAQPYVSGWYRKTVLLPRERAGKRVLAEFDAIGYEATLYVNGKQAGSHHGSFTPWEIDITPFVKFGAHNTLALQVRTDFGPVFGDPKPAKHTYGCLWSVEDIKGGIWQSARLRFEEPVYLRHMLITPLPAEGAIEVDYCIENQSQDEKELSLFAVVSSAMRGDGGLEAANVELGKISLRRGANPGRCVIGLDNPCLWAPDNPYLYYLTLALADQQGVVTAAAERFGFREFKAVGKDFHLNGERVYLFGENLPAVSFGGFGIGEDEDARELAGIMVDFKRQGYNIIRNAHMPIIPLALRLADEIGMMIYNEWAWYSIDTLDPSEFERRNLKEMTEWVYRDYNHPSVVMWSCGNEVAYSGSELTYDQLNKQVALLRELDRSARPISAFSGAAYGYGTEQLDTDVIDLHMYLGLSSCAWTNWEASLDSILEFAADTYGENHKLNKPFVIWECVGYSWGGESDPGFAPNDIDKYASYAKRATTWAAPAGIGFAGTIGLAAALDPDRGLKYGREHYGKRIMELIRYQHQNVQGFAPWFLDPATPAAPLWNQPLFLGLRDEGGVPLTNLFAGRSYQRILFLTNSQAQSLNNVEVKLSIVGIDGEEQPLGSFVLPELGGWEKHERACQVQIPKDLAPGGYQIRLVAFDGRKEASRNFYDVFVQNREILTDKIESRKSVAVLAPNSADGSVIKKILSDLGIGFAEIADLGNLGDYEVLIIPSTNRPYQLFEKQENTLNLMRWVRDGGTLLQLEQDYSQQHQYSPIGQTLMLAENTFVDLAIPAHPVFRGLGQESFDTWQNPDRGYCIISGCQPFTVNALAVRGPFLGSTDVSNAVAEGAYGKGRIFTSQLLATTMWVIDSAATTYLWNVLSYLLQEEEPFEGIRSWVGAGSGSGAASDVATDSRSADSSALVLPGSSTVERNLHPLVIDDFERTAEWAALSDGKGAIPTVERCERQSAPECVFKGNASMKVIMPEKTAAGAPVVFGRFPLQRLRTGEEFNYLTFWVKADDPTVVSVVLPKDDWSSQLCAQLVLRPGEWRKIRLNLWDDMGLKEQKWGLGELRGELFFYNCNTNRSTVFYLDEIQFE